MRRLQQPFTRLAGIVVLLLGLALPDRPAGGAEPVDVLLVLAVDSSSSVSIDEYYIQLQGYAAAFRHPDLLKAIRSGPRQAIAVTMFEWSWANQQRVNLGWAVLRDEADVQAFAAELELGPRLVIGGETAIGAAIDFALGLFDTAPMTGGRRVLDISGDGVSNRGRSPRDARDEAVQRGVTINAVAIQNEEPRLAAYFNDQVIGGPGAFVVAANDYADFAEVILRKLIREITTISAAPAPPPPARAPPEGAGPRGDGERAG